MVQETKQPSLIEFCQQLILCEKNVEWLYSTALEYIDATQSAANEPIQTSQPHNVFDAQALIEAAQHTLQKEKTNNRQSRQANFNEAQSLQILTYYAPYALLTGCILRNSANPAICHTSFSAHAHQAHGFMVGFDTRPLQTVSAQYRNMLSTVGIVLPPLGSSLFNGHKSIPSVCWQLPAYWLSLSLFPEKYAAELLGAAYFEALNSPPDWVWDAQQVLACHHQALNTQKTCLQNALPHLTHALQTLLENPTAHNVSVGFMNGFLASAVLHKNWETWCLNRIENWAMQPEQAMVELVKSKAPFACGYHQKLKIAGHMFDELIIKNAQLFVQELGRSKWVTPKNSTNSLLMNQLAAFGGPMFRIFNQEERTTICTWIDNLPERSDTAPTHTQLTEKTSIENNLHAFIKTKTTPPQKHQVLQCSRELYHQLLNFEQYPSAHHSAAIFCNRWLSRSSRRHHQGCAGIPFHEYSHEKFHHWFETQAIEQVRSYTCIEKSTLLNNKSKQDVINEALQICPLIFIDGAWLQRWADPALISTPIGNLLYKIFSDEIGNGICQQNHPNIYRSLMKEMGIELPDFRSREFINFSQFEQDAFELPAFWLSISLFPHQYLPETLGLNLAMELSGVGGAYRQARDELHAHGFSTLFVDLHNTIDNVSSGHSAMALNAIEIWMDNHLTSNNPKQIQEAWLRIWTGYCALNKPPNTWRDWFGTPAYPHTKQS